MVNQRLIWDFEFTPTATLLPLDALVGKEDKHLKWEARFFWPGDQRIILNTIDNSLLDLANYHQKHREDYYYLLPDHDYNIKRRHQELLYKPLIKQSTHASGFGKKIVLSHLTQASNIDAELRKMVQRIEQESLGIYVKKEAFIYKFPTCPPIKLELARLEVLHKTYSSLCIEGKSLDLVETISKHLMNEPISCDYVSFLKKILK